MPASGWNGNFQPAGNGNWGGSINFAEMANMLRSGFATASTDTGHEGSTASFAPGHPEKLKDFGYRAFHEMTVAAKSMIGAYYEKGPALSIVNQGGGGGREADRGGKMLIIGGWADAAIAPGSSVDYYDSVLVRMGENKVRDSVRLFMIPGMGHSLGTNGADAFNFDSARVLQEWKQMGKAPASVVATHYKNGKEIGTRLVCAYPQVAVYKGTGSADAAANFVCRDAK